MPHTEGLSVPRKSGHTRNADLTIMQHGNRCPDLPGSTVMSLLGHDEKKDMSMLIPSTPFHRRPQPTQYIGAHAQRGFDYYATWQ
jgi:hypothetical protein